MNPVVAVENISKKFVLRPEAHQSYGVRALLSEVFGRSHDVSLKRDEFLALDDVSFTVYPGDAFALIGRNGCGKTTTLKIINGTLKPNSGRVSLHGRLQALISLGAGFDPLLSGRENIINAAAVLGLNSRESRLIVDEVIDFSELDDFIDSPVQTYSSGMYARLGFSVAVHMKPDVLLVDEILAVGDYAFQNKCYVKMNQLKASGTAIILVSHSHNKVVQICENALWLKRGKMEMIGPAMDVVESYVDYLENLEASKNGDRVDSAKSTKSNSGTERHLFGPIYEDLDHVEDIRLEVSVNDHQTDVIQLHDSVKMGFSFRLNRKVHKLNAPIVVYGEDGLLMTAFTPLYSDELKKVASGRVVCEVVIPDMVLNPGEYVLVLPIMDGHSYLYRNVMKRIRVVGGGGKVRGIVDMKHEYKLVRNELD